MNFSKVSFLRRMAGMADLLPDLLLAASGLSFAAAVWGWGAPQLRSAPPPPEQSSKQLTLDSYGNWGGQPDAHRGIYRGLVVDRDPNGLNCRMRGTLQGNEYAQNPNIISMPVVATLPYGDSFSLHVFAGTRDYLYIIVEDDRGLPWVYNTDDGCFVRANIGFLDFTVHRR